MYTPYSQRHNIIDTDFAGLLDFLEREMGWEIHYRELFGDQNIIIYLKNKESFTISFWADTNLYYHFYYWDDPALNKVLIMDSNLFFRTYKTLLPEIRNLYSK